MRISVDRFVEIKPYARLRAFEEIALNTGTAAFVGVQKCPEQPQAKIFDKNCKTYYPVNRRAKLTRVFALFWFFAAQQLFLVQRAFYRAATVRQRLAMESHQNRKSEEIIGVEP